MRPAAVLEAVHRHPRHLVLLALTAGLLTGPLSAAATFGAALAVALLATAAAAPGRRVPIRVPVVAVAAAGAVLGGAVVADLRLAALASDRLERIEGRDLRARVVVLDPFRERARGPAVARGRFADGPAAGEVAVLRVATHPGEWPEVGEVVSVAGRVAPLGRYDAYQRRRGAGAAVDVSRMHPTGDRRGGPLAVVDAARRRAEAGLARGLPPPRAALLRGMVLGQDEGLSETTRTAFERSGLAHVLAVSGQNVMLLATLVLGIGALTGAPLRSRLVAALVLVAFYVPLTGAGPSIQRAGVMGAAGLVAALAGTPAHRWYALGLAAAATLAANPLAAGEVGWQLSFAAVIALLAVAPGLRGVLARFVPGPAADVAAITIAATLGTAPLMALHFDQVSLAALPANLLAAAAIAPIMWLGMLAATAAQVAPALAAPFNALNEPLLGFVENVATATAAFPFAVVPVDLATPAALAAAYAALAAAALAARAGGGAPSRASAASAARAARRAHTLPGLGDRRGAPEATGPRASPCSPRRPSPPPCSSRARPVAPRRPRPASWWCRSWTSGRATRRCCRPTARRCWSTPARRAARSSSACTRRA